MAVVQSYVTLPTITGDLFDHIGDEQLLTRHVGGGTIAQVDWGFLDETGPAGGQTTVIRVGRNLDGVADLDYAELTITGPAFAQTAILSLPLVSPGQDTVRFRIESNSGTAFNLFGTIRIETESFGIGVIAGTQYETLDKVKTAIGISLADSQFDANLTLLIIEVSRGFDNYVGYSFVSTEQIEFHDGWSHRNGIVLDRMPSESSTARGLATVEENEVLLTQGADWFFEPFPSRMIYRTNGTAESFQGARFQTGERNIKVTYDSAYFQLPPEITRACREESVRGWQGYLTPRSTSGRLGLESRTPAEGTVFDYGPDDFSQTTLRMLKSYRDGRHYG